MRWKTAMLTLKDRKTTTGRRRARKMMMTTMRRRRTVTSPSGRRRRTRRHGRLSPRLLRLLLLLLWTWLSKCSWKYPSLFHCTTSKALRNSRSMTGTVSPKKSGCRTRWWWRSVLWQSLSWRMHATILLLKLMMHTHIAAAGPAAAAPEATWLSLSLSLSLRNNKKHGARTE